MFRLSLFAFDVTMMLFMVYVCPLMSTSFVAFRFTACVVYGRFARLSIKVVYSSHILFFVTSTVSIALLIYIVNLFLGY